jgi:hypothetical protein
VALGFFDAAAVAADEAGDPALAAWVATGRASKTAVGSDAEMQRPAPPLKASSLGGERA